jgi:hypothetical protein
MLYDHQSRWRKDKGAVDWARWQVILLLRFFGMMFCHDHPVAAFVEASSQKMKIEQQI